MSASLVGSEMCIRDSLMSSVDPTAHRPYARLQHGDALSELTRPRHAALAVSYTHLTLPTICSV
eukprot:9280093-Alexandrium_andersonii.AAC.1